MWYNVSFKGCVFLLIFCLNDLSIDVINGTLEPPPHYCISVNFPFYGSLDAINIKLLLDNIGRTLFDIN